MEPSLAPILRTLVARLVMGQRAPARRGRKWETEVAEMTGGIRLGRPHEPDVLVTNHLVIECKNEKQGAISAHAIEQAREHGRRLGAPWAVAKRQKGKHTWTLTLDGDFALDALRKAELLEPIIAKRRPLYESAWPPSGSSS